MAATNLPKFPSPANPRAIARFVEYKTTEKGLAPLTISAYRSDLAQLSQSLDGRELVDAGRGDIGAHIEKLLVDYSPRSVGRKVATFREFYKFLLLDGIIQTDPMARIASPKFGRVLPKALLSESEMATALETLRPHSKGSRAERMRLRDRAAVELLYGSGLRVSELINARVADVDLVQRCIHVTGKGDKQRTAPFGHQAAEALREYLAQPGDPPDESANPDTYMSFHEVAKAFGIEATSFYGKMKAGTYPLLKKNQKGRYSTASVLAQRDALLKSPWLFPGNNGRQLTRARMWQLVHGLFQQIGLNVHPHTLRHGCATHMMNGGANLRVVQEVLGHADISTTQIYTHVSVESAREIYLRCHPRASGKSRQMKLQFDSKSAEILMAGPVSGLPDPSRKKPQKSVRSVAQQRHLAKAMAAHHIRGLA